MKIASAELQMASSHVAVSELETRESIRAWVGDRRPGFAGDDPLRLPAAAAERVDLSDAGRSLQSAESGEAQSAEDAVDRDPKLHLIRSMLEYLLGRKIRLFDADGLSAAMSPRPEPPANDGQPRPAGWGMEYDHHARYSESESTTFSAGGVVQTADGKTIEFKVELAMQRSFVEESDVSLRLGDAARKVDPLVLNFAGTAAQLSDSRFAFDLDGDGKAEQIAALRPGSGFLAFDRNRDGVVNNGSELFGPASGNGFSELATLDADHNGWIDENDPDFHNLGVWSGDQGVLRSLAEAGVGAIALTYVNSPFQLRAYAGEALGEIRSSGVFLQENGDAGTIQQVDLNA